MTDQEAREFIRQVRMLVLAFDPSSECGQQQEEFLNVLGLFTAWVTVQNEVAKQNIADSIDEETVQALYDCLEGEDEIQGAFEDFVNGDMHIGVSFQSPSP